ncbi:hypothetical protein P12x_005795 [Tundrisphaera lichenicola]|uniref:hypothetical protein n=1 Tax=Tundrisphaera lichenicola TaxID=2029860 RepID=UPI003EBB77B0
MADLSDCGAFGLPIFGQSTEEDTEGLPGFSHTHDPRLGISFVDEPISILANDMNVLQFLIIHPSFRAGRFDHIRDSDNGALLHANLPVVPQARLKFREYPDQVSRVEIVAKTIEVGLFQASVGER